MLNQGSLPAVRSIIFGSLTIGILDGLFAVVVWAIRGASPIRVFQGVSAGLLGRASFDGGIPTFLLGLLIHFFISSCVMVTYYFVSSRYQILRQKVFLFGCLYGAAVLMFMNYVVIPLSAAKPGAFTLVSFLYNLAGHCLLVGLPAALFSRAASETASAPSLDFVRFKL